MLKASTDKNIDYYSLDNVLTDEEISIRDTIREFVNKEILPIIEEYNQKMEFPLHLVPKMAELGVFGPTLPEEYGGWVLVTQLMD